MSRKKNKSREFDTTNLHRLMEQLRLQAAHASVYDSVRAAKLERLANDVFALILELCDLPQEQVESFGNVKDNRKPVVHSVGSEVLPVLNFPSQV